MRGWLMGLLFLMLAVLLAGCADPSISNIPNTVYAVGSSVDKAESHVKSAENLTTKAVPEASATGKALLSAASDEHAGAVKELESAKTEVASVQAERKQLEDQFNTEQANLTKITNGLWYKIGVWAWRFTMLLIALVAFHIIGGAVALFIPGPIGAGIGIAAAFVNPLGWFQSLRDNYFFRYVKPKQDAAAAIPSGPVVPV